MVRVVVLLGPPGSGKSTIGRRLGALGLRWRDFEPWLRAKWGERDQFIGHKVEALTDLYDEIRRFIDEGPPAAVIESTGLSDRTFIDELQSQPGTFVVRLVLSEETAIARTSARAQGEHLDDSSAGSQRVFRAFQDLVLTSRDVDLELDTESAPASDSAAQILAAISGR